MEYATHMCPACGAGLFEECYNPKQIVEDGQTYIIPCALEFSYATEAREKGPVGRPMSAPSEITDPKSTGRKRAAMLAPILTGQLCGWSGLRHAGGGVIPILGCNGNALIEKKGGDPEQGLKQGDRHHSPDKNTLNNSVGFNLHTICANCHHRWHALNDKFYDEAGRPGAEFPFLPVEAYYLHDPNTTFTEEEYAIAEAWWDMPVKDRGEYPITPSESLRKIDPHEDESDTLETDGNPFPESSSFSTGEGF